MLFCLLPEISDLGYVLQSVDKVDRWPAGTQCSSIIIDFQRKEARDRLRRATFNVCCLAVLSRKRH